MDEAFFTMATERPRVVTPERAAAPSVALSADELPPEKLCAGDTIEYYSMAFVYGDARGHRVARVLKVCTEEQDFPLRVDTEEMLPPTMMIRRTKVRGGGSLSSHDAKWRKIRTYELVDGSARGVLRSTQLNKALQSAVSDAMNATRELITGKRPASSTSAKRPSTTSSVISSFFVKETKPGSSSKQASATYSRNSSPHHKRHRSSLRDNSNTMFRRGPTAGRATPQSHCPSRTEPLVKPVNRLQAFIDHLEEKTKRVGLNSFLEIEKQRDEAKQALATNQPIDPNTPVGQAYLGWEREKRERLKKGSLDSWARPVRGSLATKRERPFSPRSPSRRGSPSSRKSSVSPQSSSRLSFILDATHAAPLQRSAHVKSSTEREHQRKLSNATQAKKCGLPLKKRKEEARQQQTGLNTWISRR